jgi:hypothetical protein
VDRSFIAATGLRGQGLNPICQDRFNLAMCKKFVIPWEHTRSSGRFSNRSMPEKWAKCRSSPPKHALAGATQVPSTTLSTEDGDCGQITLHQKEGWGSIRDCRLDRDRFTVPGNGGLLASASRGLGTPEPSGTALFPVYSPHVTRLHGEHPWFQS